MTEETVKTLSRQYFPLEIQQALLRWQGELEQVQEIRCRLGRPLRLRLQGGGERTVLEQLSTEQLQYSVGRISQGSVYAWEEEFRRGYLTLAEGHRVGLVGKGVLEQGAIRTLKQISGLNFRIARAMPGAADQILEQILADGSLHNVLLLSPPGCGKTTLLRDLIRQLSDGIPRLGFAGVNVGVVDERSELAGCVNGIPQLDIGSRTDILDGCPKSEGMRMLIRSMAPQVVAADELGTAADVLALEEALQSGVYVLSTVHGRNLEELRRHPILGRLVEQGFFTWIVTLAWKNGQVVTQCQRGDCL